MSKANKLSFLTDRVIPSHIRDNHPGFVKFITSYFEYLEREQGEYDLIANLLSYRDMDGTIDAFVQSHRNEFAPLLPQDVKTNLTTLMKNIRSFYRAKGTEDSYVFLFRALFDSYVEFYYPKVDLLRCSDGKWIEPYYLKPVDNTTENMNLFTDKKIRGRTSGATAYVDILLAIKWPFDDSFQTMFSLADVQGLFVDGEEVELEDDPSTFFTIDVDGNIKASGRWANTDGFLSSEKVMQDNDKWQDFSYVIKAEIPQQAYEKLIKQTIHPAGFKFFGELTTRDGDLKDVKDITETVVYIIKWINVFYDSLIKTIVAEETIIEGYRKYASDARYSTSYWLKNKERPDMLAKFKVSDLDTYTIEQLESGMGNNITLAFVNGLKTPISDFEVVDTDMTVTNALVQDDLLNLVYLNQPKVIPVVHVMDGEATKCPVRSIPGVTATASHYLVFKNGKLLRPSFDYYYTTGYVNFQATPALDDLIEIYVHHDYTSQRPRVFYSGNGVKKTFALSKPPVNNCVDNIMVFVNGVYKAPWTPLNHGFAKAEYIFHKDNRTIEFITEPSAGTSNIEIVYMKHKTNRLFEKKVYEASTTSVNLERKADKWPVAHSAEVTIA